MSWVQKRQEEERAAAIAARNARKDEGPKVLVANSGKKGPSKAAAAAEAARQRREAKKMAQAEVANQVDYSQMTYLEKLAAGVPPDASSGSQPSAPAPPAGFGTTPAEPPQQAPAGFANLLAAAQPQQQQQQQQQQPAGFAQVQTQQTPAGFSVMLDEASSAPQPPPQQPPQLLAGFAGIQGQPLAGLGDLMGGGVPTAPQPQVSLLGSAPAGDSSILDGWTAASPATAPEDLLGGGTTPTPGLMESARSSSSREINLNQLKAEDFVIEEPSRNLPGSAGQAQQASIMKFIGSLGVDPMLFKRRMDELSPSELLHLGDAFKQEASRRES